MFSQTSGSNKSQEETIVGLGHTFLAINQTEYAQPWSNRLAMS